VQLYAAWALINASVAEANKARIAVAGGISLLTMLLTARAPKMQAAAAHALLNLAVNKKNKAAIAAAGAIGTLVELLGRSDQSVDKFAAGALSLLIQEDTPNKAALAAAGGLPRLVSRLGGASRGVRRNAAGALLNYVFGGAAAEAEQLGEAGGVSGLLDVLLDPDPEVLRFATWALELLSAQAAARPYFAETLHQVYRLEGIVADRPALEAAKFAAAALKNVRKFAGDVDLVGGRGGGGGGGGGRLKLRLAKLGGGQQKAERAADPELTTSLFDGALRDVNSAGVVGWRPGRAAGMRLLPRRQAAATTAVAKRRSGTRVTAVVGGQGRGRRRAHWTTSWPAGRT
jgi:hypothetical protein